MYQINGLLKFAEIDNYKDGCQPETAQYQRISVSLRADTTDALIERIAEFIGCDPKDAEKNACEEPGRVDFGKMENADGWTPSKDQMKAWKRGKCELWYAVYTAHVEETRPATL